MPKFKTPIYKAAMYLRLSRDDGEDKLESDSIANQRSLIKEYVSKLDDVEIVCEMVDDGYSGSNFDRPGFTELLKAVKANEINCVIIKDLSRFSRDYIGSGMYMMNLFPKWGVRVIAINDAYDSLKPMSANDELMLSFKSIMNDIYLRDISIKIRSHLDVKRKRGKYIGAFVSYGLLKDPEDKHKVILDENVRDVFDSMVKWALDGKSPEAISDKLNDLDIPSPAEYKKSIGSKHAGFKAKGHTAKWSAQAVIRILTNPIYMGTLIQGKKTTVSHKVKKIIERDRADWIVQENAVPAMIPPATFQILQDILARDTRNCCRNGDSNIFSGILYCADCKDSMIRQTSKYKDTTYVFYRCATQKNTGGCFNHNIKEEAVYEMVLKTLNAHIQSIIGLEKAISLMSKADLTRNNRGKVERLIKEKEAEISKRKKDIFFTHQSYANGIITESEFKEFKAIYDMQISDAERSIERLKEEQANFSDNILDMCSWMKDFTTLGTVRELSHKMVVMLIDRIYVVNNSTINIVFRYKNEYENIQRIIDTVENSQRLMVQAG